MPERPIRADLITAVPHVLALLLPHPAALWAPHSETPISCAIAQELGVSADVRSP
jgi:hypothetical protein